MLSFAQTNNSQNMETLTKSEKKPHNMAAVPSVEVPCLPEEIILAAAKCADRDRINGRMIKNEDIYDAVAAKLGWK
jgi:hypothetical protein